jgi:putative transposase
MKAYKYKIRRPPKRVVQIFEQWLMICCELYNAALQERRDAWRLKRISISFAEQCAELPGVKDVRPDVAEVNAQVLQNTLRRLQCAFENFFRRVKNGDNPGFPRFKSSRRFNSFTYPQAKGSFRLEGDKLHLSKIGTVRLHLTRSVEGRLKTCQIKREADGWYVIFAVEEWVCPYFPKTGKSVGLDLGIENFATSSEGELIKNPKYLRKAERRLKRAQRNLSRKKKGSSNHRKAIKLLAKQHQKVRRQRIDFFHKESNKLLKEYDEVVFEDLNIAGMVKNHHLAKSISDAGWGGFINVHTAKAENAGRSVVKVPAAFTSQDCSRCGGRVRKTLAVREHRCIGCGLVLSRDHNAALNIKARGTRSVDGRQLPREAGISLYSL